jgi:hypothetical protein
MKKKKMIFILETSCTAQYVVYNNYTSTYKRMNVRIEKKGEKTKMFEINAEEIAKLLELELKQLLPTSSDPSSDDGNEPSK